MTPPTEIERAFDFPVETTTHTYSVPTNGIKDLLDMGVIEESETSTIQTEVYEIIGTSVEQDRIFEIVFEYYPSRDVYYLADIVVEDAFREKGYAIRVVKICAASDSPVYLYAASEIMDHIIQKYTSAEIISGSGNGNGNWYKL